MSSSADLAQRQLDAYNAHDLEAFVACYHPEVEVRDFPAGTLRLQGHAALRARYGEAFQRSDLRAEVVARVALGSVVVDEERVVGLRPGEVISAVAMYEVEGETIRRVWFVREREG